MARDAQIQMRRDTATNWTSTNPTLAAGEFGLETNTGYTKIGDGSTAWTSLPYTHSRFIDAWSQQPTSGYDIYPRWGMSTRSFSSNGIFYATVFTSGRTFSASNITMICSTGGTDTGGTTTRRMGLYTVSGNTLTLVARTASDATLFNTTGTVYTKAFDTTGGYPASYTLVTGTSYAVGAIAYNTGGTFNAPTVSGVSTQAASLLTPYFIDFATSQTDLPTSRTLAASSLAASIWARLT